MDNAVIQDNVVYFEGLYGIYATASPACAITSNSIHAVGTLADRSAIYLNQGCERSIVRGNTLLSGTVAFIVNVNSTTCVVKDNDSLAINSAVYNGNGTASSGTLYSNNSAQSAAAAYTGYSSTQRHRGFDNTRAGSYIPNVFHTTTDPTTNGRIHTKGDIYFDFSAQAVSGGYVGWICTVAGNPGTFARFGTIS